MIRVLLADDHTLVLEGFKKLLEEHTHVVGSVEDGRSLLDAAKRLRPDIVVLDISMPVVSGIEAATQLKLSDSPTKVIFLTIHNDSDFVGAAFKSGAEGYVFKTRMAADLVVAVREVMAGRTFLSSY